MPVWGWVLLVAGLSALAIAAVGLVVRGTDKLPADEPLRGDRENFAASLPRDTLRGRDSCGVR